jgi:hypothetical protein
VGTLVFTRRGAMEYSQEDITRRFAHRAWEEFEKAGLQDDPENNYRVADSIIKRIIDGSYNADEWKTFIPPDDICALLEIKKQRNKP